MKLIKFTVIVVLLLMLLGTPMITIASANYANTATTIIVDSTFDVALIVSFADRAAMQGYLTHPVHVELVGKTLKPLVEKIRVYDFQ